MAKNDFKSDDFKKINDGSESVIEQDPSGTEVFESEEKELKEKAEIIAKEETRKMQEQIAKVKEQPKLSAEKHSELKQENVKIAKTFGGITSSRLRTARG